MPSQKATWRSWNRGGPWLSGGRDDLPDEWLRVANNIDIVQTGSVRTRNGSSLLVTLTGSTGTINSIFDFNGVLFVGTTDGRLYRIVFSGGVWTATTILTGLNGNHQSFVKMPPSVGKTDSLYIANGGNDFKVDSTGAITGWGISPSVTAPTLALAANTLSTQLLSFDNDHANWTATGLYNNGTTFTPTLTDDTTNKTEGLSSLEVACPTASKSTITRALTANLANNSSDPDHITLWVHIQHPGHVKTINLKFFLGSTITDYYVSTHIMNDVVVQPKQQTGPDKPVKGIGSIIPNVFPRPPVPVTGVTGVVGSTGGRLTPGQIITQTQQYDTAEGHFIATGDIPGVGNVFQNASILGKLLEKVNPHELPVHHAAWKQIRIAKSQFNRVGTNTSLNWANVTSIAIVIATNALGAANVWFDDLRIQGGVGMQGDYTYAYVYLNSTAQIRSNPSPTATVFGSQRQGVTVSNIIVSTDTQVDKIEIYRTVGNGGILFLAGILNNTGPGPLTYTDTAADFPGYNGGNENLVLQPWTLQYDNLPGWQNLSVATNQMILAGPYQGSVFWVSPNDAHPGRLYYSPPGRPEGTENYLDITNNDDPLQRPIIFQNNLYVFSNKHCFIITPISNSTTSTLFTYDIVEGVPGTVYPWSFAIGLNYLIYQDSSRGIMAFTGAQAARLSDPALTPLFLGDTVEGYTPFTIEDATFARDEYIGVEQPPDTLQAFALTEQGHIRATRPDVQAIYWSSFRQKLIGGVGLNVIEYEPRGIYTDFAGGISWKIMTSAKLIGIYTQGVVRQITFDINCNGQTVTPTLLLDNQTIALPTITNAARGTIKYRLALPGRVLAVQLTATATARIELFSIEADVYGGNTAKTGGQTGGNIQSSPA